LANTLGSYGIVLLEGFGKTTEAEACYRRAITMWEKLGGEFPDHADIQIALGGVLHNLGRVLEGREQWAEARSLYERAIACQRRGLSARPSDAKSRQFLRNHFVGHSHACILLKDHAAAAASAMELPKLYPGLWRAHLTAAALLAPCVAVAEGDTSLPSADARAATAASYAANAVACVRQAIATGFTDAASLQNDPVFAPLRSHGDFQALISGSDRPAAPGTEGQGSK
jgi:tetratricopeptide (TPR) repeat protein